jgi:hypothetical protein
MVVPLSLSRLYQGAKIACATSSDDTHRCEQPARQVALASSIEDKQVIMSVLVVVAVALTHVPQSYRHAWQSAQ